LSLKSEALKIVTLLANNAGPYTGRTGNNTYLLPGREPTLIDAGVGDAAHIDAISAALGDSPLARVIVTHAHSDHASGVEQIAARWPSARFFKMPWPDRDVRYPARWEALADRDRVPAGDDELVVVHTPGHAPDHICLWHEPGRLLFSGDLVVKGITVVIPGGRGGSVSAYLRSLEHLLFLNPASLLPAHGPAIYEVEKIVREYIDHRNDRERQIVSALAGGARTPDEIVSLLYPFIHPALRGAARESVLAHLLKLQEEGTACEAGGKWATIP
jgi:glyoxylase-like metal-dependent hydrolase (beta-lactamase superfamily II)